MHRQKQTPIKRIQETNRTAMKTRNSLITKWISEQVRPNRAIDNVNGRRQSGVHPDRLRSHTRKITPAARNKTRQKDNSGGDTLLQKMKKCRERQKKGPGATQQKKVE
ncbi:hypothetical protein RUM43_012477 [Polyplax serrata]|uniref:Uncharacterized protein n=1 Tax=Polyplax serrata TaxID=468196 RepID=A0AAN8NRQ4_POLSC